MRPKRLRLRNFGCFRGEHDVDFGSLGSDLFAIAGPTGSGKSTLLDAMTWALYGATPRLGARPNEHILTPGENDLSVVLEFTAGGQEYRATRGLKRRPSGTASEAKLERRAADGTWKALAETDRISAYEAKLREVVGLDYDGYVRAVTLPQNAFDELLSGIKAQVAIKLFGDDLEVLQTKATEIHNAIDNIPGLVDLAVEQSFGQPQVQIVADREACARYGVDVRNVLELVEIAIGGEVIDSIYLHTRRFGIHVRYQEPYRRDPQAIQDLLVRTDGGALIPLKQVADVRKVTGPIQINREQNHRRWVIQANVRGRDLGGVVAQIRQRIAEKVTLPSGYYVEYGGQFENQQRAMTRLSIIVPVAIALVFFMLCLTFGSIRNALLIIINVPLALIGGVMGLFLTGEYLSVPAAVGFIALFGIAVQNGVVLVSCINQLRGEGMGIDQAVLAGSLQRLRPVLMTALTTVLGLLPLLLAGGIGSEVQRPLATVVVFGLTSATFLTLFVIPAFYRWFAAGGENDS